jgi:hypothetical protein
MEVDNFKIINGWKINLNELSLAEIRLLNKA